MTQTRMTKQRTLILETLRSVTSHPTADELHGMVREHMPRISLGTVYRNLEHLASTGDIICLERSGSQKHFDGNTMPHLHARCRLCGAIHDIMLSEAMQAPVSVSVPGFSVERVELEFIGVCAECERAEREKSA